MKKYKVIIDTDPGVDDIACLVFALTDKKLDVKLVTTVSGNVRVETSTRNILHLLDMFNIDVPVAKGEKKAMFRVSPTAEDVHSKEGMGGWIPSKTTEHKAIKESAVEAMYRVLSEGDGDIIPFVFGPHTNMGMLLTRHPDIIKKFLRLYLWEVRHLVCQAFLITFLLTFHQIQRLSKSCLKAESLL